MKVQDWIKPLVLGLIITVLAAFSLQAQVTTGSITGRVIDSSGAVIPGATVELTNVATQAVRTTATNDSGDYLFAFMPLGTYRLKVEQKGFQTYVRTDIQALVNVIQRVDVTLVVGGAEQTVEVSGVAAALETQTGEIGNVVEHQTVIQLPLNGRNFIQLIALQPGGVSTAKLQGGGISYVTSVFGGNYSVHGAPAEGTNYLLDGIDMRDTVDSRVGFQLTVDAIQEFKFQASNYSAAFGRGSGGQINIVSRSGSNQLHGSVWEFIRNDLFDARNFFDSVKPPYRQNQFGAAGGGRIIKDKLFFFASYEGFRSIKGITRAVTVPTLKQRAGDFSGGPPIFNPLDVDPATGLRSPFVGNQIPPSMWNPVAVKALQMLYPVPNVSGTVNNLVSSPRQIVNSDQGNIRLDYKLRDSDSFFARYTDVQTPRDFPWVYTPMPNFSSVWNSLAKNGAIAETHIFSPNTINEFRFGFNRHIQVLEDIQQTVPINQELGIQGLTTDPRFQGNPNIAISGLPTSGAISNAPNDRTDNAFVWLDNFSHAAGSHNLSAGILIERAQQNGGANTNSHGNFTFNGSFTSQLASTGLQSGTGNAVADFLLGFPYSTGRCCVQGDGFRNFRKTDLGIYFQDDWKVRSNLTLNLGLRWEYFMPPTEVTNRYAQPDLTAAPAVVMDIAGQNGVPRSLRESDLRDFSPRVGFAYSLGPSQKTAIRGGYGIFYNPQQLIVTFNMSANPPFTNLQTFISSSQTPQLSWPNAFPSALGSSSLAFSAIDPKFRDPYNQNWNLSIEREVGIGTVLSISYIGSRGVKLPLIENLNAPLEPGPGAIGPRRPIPGLSTDNVRTNNGWSTYQALEVKVDKRLAHDLSFLSSFVWSKCMDDGAVTFTYDGAPSSIRDVRNSVANKGLCNSDERKRFVTNFLYRLPLGRGAKGGLKKVLADWEVTSILNFEDGQPFSVKYSKDNSNTGLLLDTPDVVPGQDPNNGPRTPNQWLNVNAFTTPAPFTYGTAGRNIVIGPGVSRIDFSVHKNFPITEAQRLEFRTEFFNIFNHPSFYQPGNVFGTSSFGVISGAFDGRDIQFSLKYNF